jgi:hypothetical protein
VVFTVPAPIADIAYHNKAVIYDILFKAAAEMLITIAVDSQAHRRPHRRDGGAAHAGFGAYLSQVRSRRSLQALPKLIADC